jgi:hypothetical protein
VNIEAKSTLLPESLDDYVSDTNPMRVVDVFVDEPDLAPRVLTALFQLTPAGLLTTPRSC